MMNKVICIDLRPLQVGHQNRGIGMMIKSILKHLEDNENKYIFYMFDKNNPLEDLGIKPKVKNFQIVQTKTLTTEVKKPTDLIPSCKLIFHNYTNLKKYHPDVFVQFDFTLGFPKWPGTKTVLIAFDLIPLIMKKEYLPTPLRAFSHATGKRAKIKATLKTIYYNVKYKLFYQNFKKCDKIISISNATTQSFINLLGIKSKKITTIPLAPVSQTNNYDDGILSKIKKPYIFYIGGTDTRKRIDHIVYAYNIVRSHGFDLNLVLAGNEFKDRKTIPDNKTRDAITASPYKKDMYFLGFISDEEKNSLYKNALGFVFCSLYEGFGLPIIEAQANSCPVIAYDNSSIPEVSGGAALLVESNNYIKMSNEIISLFNKDLRNKNIKKGLSNSKKYSWKYYVRDFKDLINK